MSNDYYQSIDAMEKDGVDREYISGWAGGALHNPKREQQRINDAYEAGYADGWDRKLDGYLPWIRQ